MRESAPCRTASSSLPELTWRAMLPLTVAMPFSIRSGATSNSSTLVARQRRHMRDAAAHLARANDTDRLDFAGHYTDPVDGLLSSPDCCSAN